MSCAADMLRLRFYRRQAHQNLLAAKHTLDQARKACTDYLKSNPPKTFRLQEAYKNSDGSYSEPHWNDVYEFSTQNAIDEDEAIQHIVQEGVWTEIFDNPQDDPRPGCRRVIDVTW